MNDNKINLKEELTRILRDFDKIVWEDVEGSTLTILEGKKVVETRPATRQDHIDFIKGEWEAATGKLYELGIYVDENDEPKEEKQ